MGRTVAALVGTGLGSQHPYDGSQPSKTPVPKELMLCSNLWANLEIPVNLQGQEKTQQELEGTAGRNHEEWGLMW